MSGWAGEIGVFTRGLLQVVWAAGSDLSSGSVKPFSEPLQVEVLGDSDFFFWILEKQYSAYSVRPRPFSVESGSVHCKQSH